MLHEHIMDEELKGEYYSLNTYSPAKDTVAAPKRRKAAAKKERQEDQKRHQLQAIRNLVLVLRLLKKA